MLEVIGAGNPDYKGKDWGDVWASSKEYEERAHEIQQMISERRSQSSEGRTADDREFAMPLFTQITAVVKRSFTSYWRTPNYMVGKFLLHIITGLFNSFTFYHVGQSSIDMQSHLFSIFMTLTIGWFIPSIFVMLEIADDLSASTHSTTTAEIPWFQADICWSGSKQQNILLVCLCLWCHAS